MIEQEEQERIAKEQRLTKKETINQNIFNDKTLQKQQCQKNQRRFDENCFFNENNFLKK